MNARFACTLVAWAGLALAAEKPAPPPASPTLEERVADLERYFQSSDISNVPVRSGERWAPGRVGVSPAGLGVSPGPAHLARAARIVLQDGVTAEAPPKSEAEKAPPAPAEPAPPASKTEAAKPADASLAAVSSALEKGYGKLFEGAQKDEKGRPVLRFAGHDFLFDDGKAKTPEQRIDDTDMEDMFVQVYPLVNPTEKVEKDFDPGRARVEEFFKLLYGGTEAEVSKNLVSVDFCGTKVRFNAKCGAAAALGEVARELDALIEKNPGVKIYTRELGGTFQWRMIAGTKRLSNHSFGTAIDLNVKKSAYWRWAPAATLATFSRKDWPTELIEIFERHGFIWGGKWWHYDTMHFEYRPELIAFSKAAGPAESAPPPAEKPPAEKAPPPPKEPSAKPPLKGADLLVPLKGKKHK